MSNLSAPTGFDADQARYDRMNRTQQAPFAPGQGDPFAGGGMDDLFGASTVPNSNSDAMADIFSSSPSAMGGVDMFGSMPGAPGANSLMPPTQQNTVKGPEDQFYDAIKSGAKATTGFIKELSNGIAQITPLWWYKYFYKECIISVVVVFIGLISKLFGLDSGFKIAIGGMLVLAGSLVGYFALSDSSKKYTSLYKEDDQPPVTSEPVGTSFGQMGQQSGGMDDFMGFNEPTGDSGFDFGADLDGDYDDDPYSEEDEDDYEDDWGGFDATPHEEPAMSTEDALASLPEVPQGMYERKYLYDMFTKRMPALNPSFADMVDTPEDSDEFMIWCEQVIEAARCAGCKEDYLPDVMRVQENVFTIIVTCTRPQGSKPDQIGLELASIYSYDEEKGERNPNVFAKVDTVGATIRVTLFKGTSCFISLKDMMKQEESFILDTGNYIPVILGVSQLGKVITADFKKIESIIITGMPRSGKSWLVQAVLTQMCAFVSPCELHIYICDPKEGISDFKSFVLPHVKKFVSGDNNIVNTLRDLVKREAPRRKKIIGDAGFVNIWDYKEKYPDVKLPIIYVVVDEVVTLASRMDKEVNNEFRMLLRELISQLPALGIRAFLIPHVLNNDIIEKKTSDLVPCKISVCGDADHIEKATGSKFKDFPYRLVNKGDMAIKLTGHPNTIYVHGPALTPSNSENGELFDYLRRVWAKLEPTEVAGSVAEKAQEELEIKEISDSLLSNDALSGLGEDLDLF